MKTVIAGILVVGPVLALGQVVWSEDFDSLALGQLHNQNGWFNNTLNTNVVAGGGSLPIADSGSQMATNQPTVGASFQNLHVPTGWNTRDIGNDTLVLTGALFVSSGTANLGSAIFQVVGTNPTPARMGFAGIAGNRFFFGTDANTQLGGVATLDQWNILRIEVDTVNHTNAFFANGGFLGSGTYDPSLVLNNWGFSAVALSGNVSKPVFYDSMSVEAVPEPMTLVALGIGSLVALRRKRD